MFLDCVMPIVKHLSTKHSPHLQIPFPEFSLMCKKNIYHNYVGLQILMNNILNYLEQQQVKLRSVTHIVGTPLKCHQRAAESYYIPFLLTPFLAQFMKHNRAVVSVATQPTCEAMNNTIWEEGCAISSMANQHITEGQFRQIYLSYGFIPSF